MTINEFLAELQDSLQREEELTLEMVLKDLPEWDSLAMMSVVVLFDKHFNKKLTFSDFENLKTVSDLVKKTGL